MEMGKSEVPQHSVYFSLDDFGRSNRTNGISSPYKIPGENDRHKDLAASESTTRRTWGSAGRFDSHLNLSCQYLKENPLFQAKLQQCDFSRKKSPERVLYNSFESWKSSTFQALLKVCLTDATHQLKNLSSEFISALTAGF